MRAPCACSRRYATFVVVSAVVVVVMAEHTFASVS